MHTSSGALERENAIQPITRCKLAGHINALDFWLLVTGLIPIGAHVRKVCDLFLIGPLRVYSGISGFLPLIKRKEKEKSPGTLGKLSSVVSIVNSGPSGETNSTQVSYTRRSVQSRIWTPRRKAPSRTEVTGFNCLDHSTSLKKNWPRGELWLFYPTRIQIRLREVHYAVTPLGEPRNIATGRRK